MTSTTTAMHEYPTNSAVEILLCLENWPPLWIGASEDGKGAIATFGGWGKGDTIGGAMTGGITLASNRLPFFL